MMNFEKILDNKYIRLSISLFLIAVLLFPIIFLYFRDGIGSAVFPVHDQLDEIILNYVFPARHPFANSYNEMMCGIPASGLKPFAPIFVPLYMVFSVYMAFLIQHITVIITAYLGMFICVKEITNRNIASFVAAFLFALLPIHSIYGNVVAGTPLLIYCIIKLIRFTPPQRQKNLNSAPFPVIVQFLRSNILPLIGLVYYALSTSFALSGWAATGLILAIGLLMLIFREKNYKACFLSFFVLFSVFLICNIDLFVEVFSPASWISHRTEFDFGEPTDSFLSLLWMRLSNGSYTPEAESYHELIIIPVLLSSFILLWKKDFKNKHAKSLIVTTSSILILCILCAILGTKYVYRFQHSFNGILRSFQLSRFHYFLPGLWFILLGISVAIITDFFVGSIHMLLIGYVIITLAAFPTLNKIEKHSIFYQNRNQINNGQRVTGAITMKNLYAEDLMSIIEKEIGKEKSSYRIVNMGISPVVALINGFYTIDGYSNNYPLEYKHKFRELIAGELEKNDYAKAYFDCWGSRCYCFYHEWGNGYMLDKNYDLTVNDLHLNMSILKELNCQYIFSAGEILNCENYDLRLMGDYQTDSSIWHIWLYEVK